MGTFDIDIITDGLLHNVPFKVFPMYSTTKAAYFDNGENGIETINKGDIFRLTIYDPTDFKSIDLAIKPDGYNEKVINLFDLFPTNFPESAGANAINIEFSGSEKGNKSTFIKEPGNNTLQLAILAAGVYMIAKKNNKKVSGLTLDEIFPLMLIGIGLLGFSVIKKFLESIGLWKSGDTKALDGAGTDPNSFWNPMWFTTKPANASYTYSISRDTMNAYVNELQDAFGAFNDCEECAIGIFKRFKTKANASFFSYAFNQATGEDLLTYLRGGSWPQDRLSDTDVNTINTFISRLPNW